jgi:chitosanase
MLGRRQGIGRLGAVSLVALGCAVSAGVACGCSGAPAAASLEGASGAPSSAPGPSAGTAAGDGVAQGTSGASGPDDADAAAPAPVEGDAGPGDAATTPDPPNPAGGLTALQKHKAEMLTSLWENSTTVLQYSYCENIKDGRGYTSGRAGFCSGTGDAILVVKCFDEAFGTGASNPMARYMPALVSINDRFESTGNDQADTSPLDAVGAYCSDWSKATASTATAAAFQGCQDVIAGKLYYEPGLALASRWGLVTALTKAELYDAEINHGDDGVVALVKLANQDVGNAAQKAPAAPLGIAEESAWLGAFLLRRLQLLGSDPTWADAVDRVTTYEQLRKQGNFDLSGVIRTDAKAVKMYPSKGYKDSGYPDCSIAPDGTVTGDAACTSATGQ